jgi:hypothetical protein
MMSKSPRAVSRKAPGRSSAAGSRTPKAGGSSSTTPRPPRSSQQTVEGYIGALSGWESSAVRTICNIVRATAPNARETMKASLPTYEENGPFCYVEALSGSVTFAFWRGAELSDPRRLLQGSGSKMRHVKLTKERDVDPRAFAAFVKQAVELNRRLGDPSR